MFHIYLYEVDTKKSSGFPDRNPFKLIEPWGELPVEVTVGCDLLVLRLSAEVADDSAAVGVWHHVESCGELQVAEQGFLKNFVFSTAFK